MNQNSSNQRFISASPWIALFATLLGLGSIARATSSARLNEPISIEAARHALVEMLTHSDNEPLKMSLDFVRTVAPVQREDGSVALGPWIVSPADREFTVTIHTETLFEDYAGSFTQDANGDWKADIRLNLRSCHLHLGP